MSEDRGDRIRRPRGRKPRRKVCAFCVDKVQHIDYKDVMRLRRFTSERGKILPRRMMGTCEASASAVHGDQARAHHRAAAVRFRIIGREKASPKGEAFFV